MPIDQEALRTTVRIIRGDREHRFGEHSLRHHYREDELLVPDTKPPEPSLCTSDKMQKAQTQPDCSRQCHYHKDDGANVHK